MKRVDEHYCAEVMTGADLSKYLSVPVATLYALRNKRYGPASGRDAATCATCAQRSIFGWVCTCEQLMSPVETADYVHYSPATLRNWRSAGEGPRYVRVGKHARYWREDVDAWLISAAA